METTVMYTVKLSFHYDWPFFRQTPGFSGTWGNYKFVIDDNLKECDFWVVYSAYKFQKEKCICNPANTLFLPAEGYETSPRFSDDFLNQFGKVITVQKEIAGSNVIHWQNANPWFVESSYDELVHATMPEKTKLLSIVSSNNAVTEGHRKRLEFANRIKAHFGDEVDMYGRGIRGFDQKKDVLAPYKFHVAIENDSCDDWITEKFFDPLLTFTYPIYYGCPNLEKYMPAESFTRIDINDFDGSVRCIEKLLVDEDKYTAFTEHIGEYRKLALDTHQFFPMIVSFLEKMSPDLPKQTVTLHPCINLREPSFFSKVKRKLGFH